MGTHYFGQIKIYRRFVSTELILKSDRYLGIIKYIVEPLRKRSRFSSIIAHKNRILSFYQRQMNYSFDAWLWLAEIF